MTKVLHSSINSEQDMRWIHFECCKIKCNILDTLATISSALQHIYKSNLFILTDRNFTRQKVPHPMSYLLTSHNNLFKVHATVLR